MARILILIGSHLCTAPRPQKEARALAEAGHEVTVAGGWFDQEFARWDERLLADAPFQFVRVADQRPGTPGARIRRWASRLRRSFARRRFVVRGHFSPELLGLFPRETLHFARTFAADLTVAHAEGGLWVAAELQKSGRNVGVDFEDWFSRDLLPADRIHRPIEMLDRLETGLLQSSRYALTTSHALAEELARAYGTAVPAVVYNTFPITPYDGRHVDRPSGERPSLHWFSQTIGPGRGLEVLFQALLLVRQPCELTLRGRLPPRYAAWLQQQLSVAWKERLRVLPLVANAELPSRIAEHDVGLALEHPVNPNHDLTISNKFFQYLQAGLAVVATDTRGQSEAARQAPEACVLVSGHDPAALAAAIDGLLADPARLASAKAAARRAGATVFSWERQRGVLLERANAALSPTV